MKEGVNLGGKGAPGACAPSSSTQELKFNIHNVLFLLTRLGHQGGIHEYNYTHAFSAKIPLVSQAAEKDTDENYPSY